MNGFVVGGVITALVLGGLILARALHRWLRTPPVTATAEPEHEEEPVLVGHPWQQVLGRRRPCPCGARWPAGHPLAGHPKAIRSCCGKDLATDPAFKGSPLPRRRVEQAADRKKAQMTAARKARTRGLLLRAALTVSAALWVAALIWMAAQSGAI